MVYPNMVVKNQFGETSNQFMIGGSSPIDINFVVDPANGNGLGNRSLKGSPLVAAVYMHTSATPAVGNPNPLAGFAVVEFTKPFGGYITGFSGFVSQLSGSNINISSGLTLGQAYVIVSVGTSTAANWQALGFPANQVPAVGASFIATSASAGTGTGIVQVPASSGIVSTEVVGDPNTTCNPLTGGGQMIVQFLAPTITGVTLAYEAPMIPTAPAVGSVVGMRFSMDAQTGAPLN